jgi:preprotein translocase subunit SecD
LRRRPRKDLTLMHRVSLRILAAAAVLACSAAACSGSSSGGAGTPPNGPGVVLVATPVVSASSSVLRSALGILQKRLTTLGIGDSVVVNGSTLQVSVAKADVAAAKFVITERGLISFSQVLQTRKKPAAKCQSNPKAFGKAGGTGSAVVCDPADNLLLLLGPVAVDQGDIMSAKASTAPGLSGSVVNVLFNKAGTAAWLALTKQAFASTGSGQDGFGACKPPRGCNGIAVVLDGGLIEIPSIPFADGIAGGNIELSGNFTTPIAKDLAATLSSGPLPIAFSVPAS